MTRKEAWQEALEQAVAHHLVTTRREKDTTDVMLDLLVHGMGEVHSRLMSGRLRTNDLTQLSACALDCLGAAIYDANQRGEKPLRPDEIEN